MKLDSLEDIHLLRESQELECKLALGQDGKGELPKDFWPTYSAMANAHGGIVLLGLREKDGVFSLAGLPHAAKLRTELFNNLNNRAKVSTNLLGDADVTEHVIDGKVLLAVRIPAASRKQKPVFLHSQPFGNTYRRLNDGDRHCDEETVKRMLAEQVEDERDARILPNYGMEDLDPESLRIYRQMLRDEKPGHPFLEQDDFEFVQSLRGWRRDRQTGEAGLTIAGLLMFGRWPSIQDAMPNYFLDYQERPEAKAELRWVDRLVPDGSWTGNLFEFYRRVYRKLTADLKVPFALKDGQRQDDTPVHQALREALVNTLVHADYTGRVSVLVVKRPDMFGFRNPGGLRLPLEQVIRGGESDCRNRILHQMFLLIGLGERGGSGMPRIYGGWKSQHWRPPALSEKDLPEQTQLALHMADLLPTPALAALRQRFGTAFDELDHTGRLIMVTAALERVVSHTRLLELCDAHSHDLSVLLARLVRQGLLVSDGRSRGTIYHLPGEALPTPDQVFVGPQLLAATPGANTRSGEPDLAGGSEYSEVSSEYSDLPQQMRDSLGRLASPLLDSPVVDDLAMLDAGFLAQLEGLAAEARQKEKLPRHKMELVIHALCQDQFITLSALAKLLNRNADGLRQQYLSPMVKSGQMKLAFPTKPTHAQQAYRCA
ncbi:RNA-binding domain-containing protein [Roseateles cellulosilyticus]|uniref:DNA binding domain-containing protein n=1 Tax=Pelomonas cellulosilytica TaxID=2906762 RepID=A0ABS8XM85_9BURK|nr:RNA-binding domain-containing protein [Pelomonas sp. P8]MCE4553892.1 putative DNA binding domain-containing protein [Pelomonas sp. P8]